MFLVYFVRKVLKYVYRRNVQTAYNNMQEARCTFIDQTGTCSVYLRNVYTVYNNMQEALCTS